MIPEELALNSSRTAFSTLLWSAILCGAPGLGPAEAAEAAEAQNENSDPPAFEERLEETEELQKRSFVITPYRLNYLLPYSATTDMNRELYRSQQPDFGDNLKDYEAKFQISFSLPLHEPGLITQGDGFYFAFTMKSWWQVYSHSISAPFRETNYRPEFFYFRPLRFMRLGGGEWSMMIGLEHESNGRTQALSRSWNRAFAELFWAKGHGVISFRPWYRFEEDPKAQPTDAKGDDNPDIEDFLGHYELSGTYEWEAINHELSVLWRQNFSKGNHAVELTYTFPLFGKLRGMVQLFDGYGESLIEYNIKQTRIGFGIAMSEVL